MIYWEMLGYAGICWNIVGYARIWWDMLGYKDMMGYGGMCWDMQGYGGICEGGVCTWLEALVHVLQRFFVCPPWFLHLIRKLFKLKRASRSIAKTGLLGCSKSMAGVVF